MPCQRHHNTNLSTKWWHRDPCSCCCWFADSWSFVASLAILSVTDPSNLGMAQIEDATAIRNSQRFLARWLHDEATTECSEESESDSEGEEGSDIVVNPNVQTLPDPLQDDNSKCEQRDKLDFHFNAMSNDTMNNWTFHKKIGLLLWKCKEIAPKAGTNPLLPRKLWHEGPKGLKPGVSSKFGNSCECFCLISGLDCKSVARLLRNSNDKHWCNTNEVRMQKWGQLLRSINVNRSCINICGLGHEGPGGGMKRPFLAPTGTRNGPIVGWTTIGVKNQSIMRQKRITKERCYDTLVPCRHLLTCEHCTQCHNQRRSTIKVCGSAFCSPFFDSL